MPIAPSPSSPRTPTPSDIVDRWVRLQDEMNRRNYTPTLESSPIHPHAKTTRRAKSASSAYGKPVESLTVSFAKLLVNQINGASTSATSGKRAKKKVKKKPNFNGAPVRITIRNNKPVTQINHVEEWLQHRSAHYAWWRKLVPSSLQPSAPVNAKPLFEPNSSNNKTTNMVNHSQPHQAKAPRCILWFQFTGNPSKRPGSSSNKVSSSSANNRTHNIRIEQQPLGGANALVFAADLRIGEDFAIVSRRQPGFTFSLTFFIDGVRHARLSGCCENARNLHVPTRVGGPIGAFVLRTVQGGAQCHVCEKSAPFADPELFTVWPKTHYRQYSHIEGPETERSHDGHLSSRKRSSTRRIKPVETSPVIAISPSNTYPNEEPFYEQPSSDAIVPEYASADDTFEEQTISKDNVPNSSSIDSHKYPSCEDIPPGSLSVEEICEEQISTSDFFIPGSVSIEEVCSIGSPMQTPQSTLTNNSLIIVLHGE